eukprot:CAMPEP_0173291588 /NCGR_PEP_ID=MMETSP1143-20121109/12241_1 /TAXON_ID=483371 /ORGANISM="non described non described, Strain CCMP2298" /LENGTH=58 /DNA_ID=CAMNT_0014230851 /DNA_START=246 /DNA_END=422 /DNA_ORIENTATION=+
MEEGIFAPTPSTEEGGAEPSQYEEPGVGATILTSMERVFTRPKFLTGAKAATAAMMND